MAQLFAEPFFTALDSDGAPVSGAKLHFYLPGTSTPLDTFADHDLTVAHSNPVVADSAGRFAPIYLRARDYKVVLADAGGATVRTIDPVNVSADDQTIRAAGAGSARALADWFSDRENVKAFGAVGDASAGHGDGTVTAGSATLSSAGVTFSDSDLGKTVVIEGAATAGLAINKVEAAPIDNAARFDAAVSSSADLTAALNDPVAGDVAPFSAAMAAGDLFVIGHRAPFSALTFEIGTPGEGGTVVWKYWDGAAWTALSNVTDGTAGFTAAAGGHGLSFDKPGDWAPRVFNPGANGDALYYVAAELTAVYATAPVLDRGAIDDGEIRITTAADHGLQEGQTVTVRDVAGAGEANGSFTIRAVDAARLDLAGSAFGAAHSGGGTVHGRLITTIASTLDGAAHLADEAGASIAGSARFLYGTDDSLAVGAAVDRALVTGKPLWLPKGAYLVAGLSRTATAELRLLMDPGATLLGVAQGDPDGAGTPLFRMRAGLVLDGTGGAFENLGPVFVWDGHAGDVERVVVRGVTFKDTGYPLRWVDQGNGRGITGVLAVEGCRLENCRDGIHFAVDKLAATRIAGNRMKAIGSRSVATADGIHLGNEDALHYESRQGAVVADNLIERVTGAGETHGISARMGRVSISGNTIKGVASTDNSDEEAIYVKARDSVISGNIVIDGGSAGNGMIAVKGEKRGSADTPGHSVIVANNVVRNTGEDAAVGIGIVEEDVQCIGNRVEGNFQRPIYVSGMPGQPSSGRIQVSLNQIYGVSHGSENIKCIDVAAPARELVITQNVMSQISTIVLNKSVIGIRLDTTLGDTGDIENILISENVMRDLTATGGASADSFGMELDVGSVSGDRMIQLFAHHNLFDNMDRGIVLVGTTRPSDMIDCRVESNSGRNITGWLVDNQINYPLRYHERGNTLDGVRQHGIGEVVPYEVTVNYGSLTSGGVLRIVDGFQQQRFKVREIFLSGDGTNFSGGNRNIEVFSASLNFTVIPAGIAQALTAARWGDTGAPYPSLASEFFAETGDGADLNVRYQGGTTDYTAGELRLLVMLERTR